MTVPASNSLTTADDDRSADAGGVDANDQSHAVIRRHEKRNIWTLASYHVMLRVAWIFKTESVIIPAFVDAISGAGWLRGCLPLLNRVGQSVPSLLFANQLRQTKRKKWALLFTAWGMAIPFLIIAAIWWWIDDKKQPWLPPLFMVLYFLFFCVTGLNQLSFGTANGKLIRAKRRGRLQGISAVFGTIPAILAAWYLLRIWLERPNGGFDLIFATTGIGFMIAGLIAYWIVEPADHYAVKKRNFKQPFYDAFTVLKTDRNFRRLSGIAVLFMTSQMLFPHYQALGREQDDYQSLDLMVWVIMQNCGMGVFSVITGLLADRFGNRFTLRCAIAVAAITPLVALLQTGRLIDGFTGPYWLVFSLLSTVPVMMKILNNYTLELCEPEKHPQYISTMKVCLAVPFFLSPLLGLLIDMTGFFTVFFGVFLAIATAGLLTSRISEPRWE